MGFKDENILNALQNVSKFLKTILFTGSNLKVEDYDSFEEMVELKNLLKKRINDKEFKLAEKELFLEIEKQNSSYEVLRVGFWFFLQLSLLDEKVLNEGGFKKEDVLYGMRKIEEAVI